MANEVTNALLVTNGGRTAEVLSALLLEKLYDKTSLRQYIRYVPHESMGSSVTAVTFDAVPGAAAAASSEISGGASNSAYTTDKVQMTLAAYLKTYQLADFLVMTGGEQQIGAANLVNALVKSLDLTLTDLICALFPSLATQAGVTTVNLSVSNIYSAMYSLIQALVPVDAGAPVTAVLHPVQRTDFMESLRNEPGAVQFQPYTADMLTMKGPGAFGSWNGINFVGSDSCGLVNTSEDRCGAMFGADCFGYQLGNVQRLLQTGLINPGNILVNTPEMFVETGRTPGDSITSLWLKFFCAVVELEDLRGVKLVSDA